MNRIKNSLISVGIASALLGLSLGPAYADGWSTVHYARARVVGVEPIMRTVQVRGPSERTCWIETVPRQNTISSYNPDVIGNTLIGAVIGGVIGHQFGRDGHYAAATTAGALLGGAIGNNLSHSNVQSLTVNQHIRRCEVRHPYRTVREVVAYRVHYRFHGRIYTVRMHREPGRFIRVRVNQWVSPVH